jgi:hypothetical protein
MSVKISRIVPWFPLQLAAARIVQDFLLSVSLYTGRALRPWFLRVPDKSEIDFTVSYLERRTFL